MMVAIDGDDDGSGCLGRDGAVSLTPAIAANCVYVMVVEMMEVEMMIMEMMIVEMMMMEMMIVMVVEMMMLEMADKR